MNARLHAANAELVQMHQAQAAFFNNAAHELRTPLASIRSSSELLMDRRQLDDEAREFAGIVNDESGG